MSTMREQSKQEWTGANTGADINSGSLQRIADAVEKMASSYDAVRDDRDLYKRWYEESQRALERARRQISALKGVVTKVRATAGKPAP